MGLTLQCSHFSAAPIFLSKYFSVTIFNPMPHTVQALYVGIADRIMTNASKSRRLSSKNPLVLLTPSPCQGRKSDTSHRKKKENENVGISDPQSSAVTKRFQLYHFDLDHRGAAVMTTPFIHPRCPITSGKSPL